jgi:hypothetical protein
VDTNSYTIASPPTIRHEQPCSVHLNVAFSAVVSCMNNSTVLAGLWHSRPIVDASIRPEVDHDKRLSPSESDWPRTRGRSRVMWRDGIGSWSMRPGSTLINAIPKTCGSMRFWWQGSEQTFERVAEPEAAGWDNQLVHVLDSATSLVLPWQKQQLIGC